MDKKTIQDIMNFMLNAQLSGRDVMKFNDCMNALYDELKQEENKGSHQKPDEEAHR